MHIHECTICSTCTLVYILDNQDIESNQSIEINSGWTIEVKEYNDKEAF